MSHIGTIVVLGLAAYRAQRLVTADSITTALREALYRFAWVDADDALADHPVARAPWRTYVYELFTCPWCLGIWSAGVVYVLWRWGGDVLRGVIVVLAIAAVQGVLANREID